MRLKTTLARLRAAEACEKRYTHLVRALGPGWGDDQPISILQILNSNGLDDALWALERCDGAEQLAARLAREYASRVLLNHGCSRFASQWIIAACIYATEGSPRFAAGNARMAVHASAGCVAGDAENLWQEIRLHELLAEEEEKS